MYSFVASFIGTLMAFIWLASRMKGKGLVTKDQYKKGKPNVISMGGLFILFGLLAGLSASVIEGTCSVSTLAMFCVIFGFSIFALIDDLLKLNKRSKIIIPFLISLPVAVLVTDTTLDIGFLHIGLGWIFPLILAPMYVMVVTNLINMHSGFNGLQTGLSLIILMSIVFKLFLVGIGIDSTMLVLGAVFAFWLLDRYPSRALIGNVGSFAAGSAIGSLLILNNQETFGIMILSPHILNFIISISQKKYAVHIFAKLRKDGTIEPPKYVTLKWLPSYFGRFTEVQLTRMMYALQFIVCGLAVVVC